MAVFYLTRPTSVTWSHYKMIELFLCDDTSPLRAKHFLCFNNCYSRIFYEDLLPLKCIYSPKLLRLLSDLKRWFCYVDSQFIVAPIVCGGTAFCPCFVMQYLVCNHLDGEKRAACFTYIVIFLISRDCFSSVASWFGLRCVIVVFPDHTPLLF